MLLDARGSAWSKWDLHVHSPASVVQHYGGSDDEVWEAFITDLENLPSAYKVIGINDYLFVDGYERLLTERAKGRLSNLDLILPVIELRLNVFGGSDSRLSKVNYHVIFSDQLAPDVIREQFLSALSSKFQLVPREGLATSAWSGVLSRKAIEDLGARIIASVPSDQHHRYGTPLQEGFNNLTLSHDAIQNVLCSSFLRGQHVTAVGKTEWADIRWKNGSIADKKTIVNGVDCVFVAAESPSAYHQAKKALADGGVNYRLFDCSDAHYYSDSKEKDRIGNSYTWVKADPTFAGLLQALEEFGQRVFVGDEPPERQRVREHASKYIDRIRIRKVPDSLLGDEWFSVDLPLNTGLIAVIGNKGSGKSALAEVIGLAGGSPHESHFSFLTPSKFRSTRQGLATQFVGELVWCDGTSKEVILSNSTPAGVEARVQHLPQRYLESLCNDVPSGGKTQFDEELERIIFAHLPVGQRLGSRNLGELIGMISGAIDAQVDERRRGLEDVNAELVRLEEQIAPENVANSLATYRALRKEWYSLQKAPPTEVAEPDSNDPALRSVRDQLRQHETAYAEVFSLVEKTEREIAANRRDQEELASLRSNLEVLQRRHEGLLASNAALLTRVGLTHAVSVFQLDTHALDEVRSRLSKGEERHVSVLEGDGEPSRRLSDVLAWLESEAIIERAKLSAPEEAREAYFQRKAGWERDVRLLLGEKGSEDLRTVLGARRNLQELGLIPKRLELLRDARGRLSEEIHAFLLEKAQKCSELYRPLQAYMDSQDLPHEYQVSVGTSLVNTAFAQIFLGELVNRQVAGSFCGVAESEHRLSALLGQVDFDDAGSVRRFLDEIDKSLHGDVRQSGTTPTVPARQVRTGHSLLELYNWVFGLSYLSPRYGLMFGGKPIYQLSPGEKGTLLLIFFLLAEVDTRPLIIDQPEDNLDNNTVFRALVHCFQRAKDRRQVLIVTHNPNLAVVCDADQIVVATMEKSESARVGYNPGAIERRDTVSSVVDILEGTQPAFKNRSVKYTIHLGSS